MSTGPRSQRCPLSLNDKLKEKKLIYGVPNIGLSLTALEPQKIVSSRLALEFAGQAQFFQRFVISKEKIVL